MRLAASVLITLLLAACGGRASSSPAWPKLSEKEVDGGESLEPRTIAAMPEKEADDEEVVEDKPVEKPAEAAPVEAEPETPTPPPAVAEEPITTEEIVIEIEED